MYPHVIRLRGPWDYQPLERYDPGNLPPPGRTKLPADWGDSLGRGFRGRVKYTRAFNRPTGLEARERVWLVAEGADASGSVVLNGHTLGEIAAYALPAALDVTELLVPRNELAIEVELPRDTLRPGREDQPGGLIREVRLEVRHRVFVEQLALWAIEEDVAGPRLHVIGRLHCEPRSPANLLLTGLGRELYFGPVSTEEPIEVDVALPSGVPQWVAGSACALEPIDVRVLLRGEAVWETQRRTAIRPSWADDQGATPLAEVLTEESYEQFDRQGQAVIQSLPAGWAEEVRPRLAHHPSIVGWIET